MAHLVDIAVAFGLHIAVTTTASASVTMRYATKRAGIREVFRALAGSRLADTATVVAGAPARSWTRVGSSAGASAGPVEPGAGRDANVNVVSQSHVSVLGVSVPATQWVEAPPSMLGAPPSMTDVADEWCAQHAAFGYRVEAPDTGAASLQYTLTAAGATEEDADATTGSRDSSKLRRSAALGDGARAGTAVSVRADFSGPWWAVQACRLAVSVPIARRTTAALADAESRASAMITPQHIAAPTQEAPVAASDGVADAPEAGTESPATVEESPTHDAAPPSGAVSVEAANSQSPISDEHVETEAPTSAVRVFDGTSKFAKPAADSNLLPIAINRLDVVEERVTLLNSTSATVGLGGWTVVPLGRKQRFTFPLDYELGAGAYVNLWTGPDADKKHAPPTDLFWTRRRVWRNKGECPRTVSRRAHVWLCTCNCASLRCSGAPRVSPSPDAVLCCATCLTRRAPPPGPRTRDRG